MFSVGVVSNTFSRLYQSWPFPVAILAYLWLLTDHYWGLEDSIETMFDYINENYGYTKGWYYTHSLMNIQLISNICNTNQRNAETHINMSQVKGGTITYHPCFIQSTNRYLISSNLNIG